jgi:hypothetical protein
MRGAGRRAAALPGVPLLAVSLALALTLAFAHAPFASARASEPAQPGTDPLPDECDARRAGIAALPAALCHVDADDPDLRFRARRLALVLACDHWRRTAPEGTCYIAGTATVTSKQVTSNGFYLGAREVTRAEFRAFARRHPRAESPKRWDDGPGDLPATSVSLVEARAYAEAHDMRLPTLAELAHAATSADTDPYPWGGHYDAARANTRESGIVCLRPVVSFQSGASRHGVLDVLGNAAEWTETRIGRHEFAVAGGSYRGPLVSARLRGFRTYRLQPTARLADVGLRLARSLPALGTAAD